VSGIWRAIVIAAALLVLAPSPSGAQSVERYCGAITALFIGDLPSGGSITIDQRRYLVGTVAPDSPRLPPHEQLVVGVRVCAEGTAVPVAGNPGVFRIAGGRTVIESSLPSTSTSDAGPQAGPAVAALAVVLLVATWVQWRRRRKSSTSAMTRQSISL